MRIHTLDRFQCCPLYPGQGMFNRQDDFPYNIIFKFNQKIVSLTYHSGGGILDGQNRKISRPLFDCFHCIPESLHMKAIDILSKIGMHSSLGISSVCPLENDP